MGQIVYKKPILPISTHALREEGDLYPRVMVIST